MSRVTSPAVTLEARPLAGTRFAEEWLRRQPSASALLPGDPTTLSSYEGKAREVASRFDSGARREIARLLSGGGPDGAARLASFVDRDGFMVTTGQQPGLFGGPLYALYKALTAAALAHRLEDALGRPVLPVFWIASEHHVWEDVASVQVVDPENTLHDITLPVPGGARGRPLHRVLPGKEVVGAVERFLSLHPPSEFLPRWKDVLSEAYTPDHTLPEAFRRVMAELLGEAGVFLLFAHDPALKARSLPLLLRELDESASRETAIATLDATVREAGFEPQVPYLEGATNLFFVGPEGRERLFRDGGRFRLRGSERAFLLEEVRARATDDPSLLSPNVLLRPVVEAACLPTLSYVAGPGEIAYLPHATPVFDAHGVARPIVHPRVALWVVEGKVGKILKKFGLTLEDLSLPEHELAGRLAREEMPPTITKALREMTRALAAGAEELSGAVTAIDPTLRGPVDGFRSQSGQLLADVERKILTSLKRENEVALGQASKARLHLFPLGRPQERVFNPIYYLARYAEGFTEAVNDRAREAVLL
jgi:bacillithiol biosynthesis cysteine-adding enzyme BshC